MTSIFLRNTTPVSPNDLAKAKTVLAEVDQLKETLLPYDQSVLDSDRKRGTLEMYGKRIPDMGIVLAELKVDAYVPEKPLQSLQVSVSKSPESRENTYVIDEHSKWYQHIVDHNEQGEPETRITHKHDRSTNLYQTVYVDVETGEIGYREEMR